MCKPVILLEDESGLPPIVIKTQSVVFPNITDFGHLASGERSAPKPYINISLPLVGERMEVSSCVR